MIKDLWYKNGVIYCLSVGTYMDANGDGIGDFQGLMRRLDYLHGLGITAIWLMPFQTSPGRTTATTSPTITASIRATARSATSSNSPMAAKQRGIRVIIDLVVNHTSDQHPLVSARRGAIQEFAISRLVCLVRQEARPTPIQGMVFPGVQKSTWTRDKEAGAWYFHRFYDFQPDLNTSNPQVQAEILKIMGFWIQLGVSGFRMDAVPFVIATKGAKVAKPVEQYDMLRVVPRISAMAGRRRHHPRRGQRAARNRHGVFRRRRRPHAHDVQFPGQPESVLCAGLRRYAAAGEGAEGDQAAARPPRNGACSCATTTSSTSAA